MRGIAPPIWRSLEHESLNFDPPAMPNYTYTILDEERKLNPDGSVKSISAVVLDYGWLTSPQPEWVESRIDRPGSFT
jgi:hypothetical protein